MVFFCDVLKCTLEHFCGQLCVVATDEELFHEEFECLGRDVKSPPVLELKHHFQETLAKAMDVGIE